MYLCRDQDIKQIDRQINELIGKDNVQIEAANLLSTPGKMGVASWCALSLDNYLHATLDNSRH
jgi:hypothetical protein